MGIDRASLEKYRNMSSFKALGSDDDFERNAVLQQAIKEFDYYQKYSPNTHKVFVNDSKTPILATFIDVSDLEVQTDSKWMLTSLKNDIKMGDIIHWGKRTWMCIYDKEKNTANCYKVKVQPCNYPMNVILFEDTVNMTNPKVFTIDTLVLTYLTDTRATKQILPTNTGTTFLSMQYNKYTSQLIDGRRIWIHEAPFIIAGMDYTNIDYYTGYGILKCTLRPEVTALDSDNKELKVCDYYNYFPLTPSPSEPVETGDIVVNVGTKTLDTLGTTEITAEYSTDTEFEMTFVGGNNKCTLQKLDGRTYRLTVGINTGYVTVRVTSVANPSITKDIKFLIR